VRMYINEMTVQWNQIYKKGNTLSTTMKINIFYRWSSRNTGFRG